MAGSRMTQSDYFLRWTRLAAALNLSLTKVSGAACGLPSDWGEVLVLENFGARNGMILLPAGTKVLDHSDAICAKGFGYSVIEPGVATSAELDSLKGALRDWGWTGSNADRPTWY